ncbi:MAG: hypothetical protein BHW56_01710 [Acetobacter sp. 46_36]|jgi:hypothetical protein|nr:MAG: hypothetical protein BHW56_01710 [Acetobacter sp. 46_36]
MSVRIFPNKQPNVHEAIDIYCNLGWGKLQDYNFEIWKKAFDNSDFISAYDENKLVGFIRLISDGFHDTQVLEFVVTPKYQHCGIGKLLIEELKDNWGHTDIYCNTVDKNIDFFLDNGFKRNRLAPISKAKFK